MMQKGKKKTINFLLCKKTHLKIASKIITKPFTIKTKKIARVSLSHFDDSSESEREVKKREKNNRKPLENENEKNLHAIKSADSFMRKKEKKMKKKMKNREKNSKNLKKKNEKTRNRKIFRQ